VCVVSDRAKADLCRTMGADAAIDRSAEDVDIVLEHPGRDTFGASGHVIRRGGTVATCAFTTGYPYEYDNRYLWMSLKRIIGSHFANYREPWEANRVICKARIGASSTTHFSHHSIPGHRRVRCLMVFCCQLSGCRIEDTSRLPC
jgi:crotonyl-CoA reductase